MIAFITFVLSAGISGNGWLSAAEAFDKPAINNRVWRIRATAFCLFMISAPLFLAAALVDSFANDRALSETLGWLGIGCLELCVIFGGYYALVNKRAADDVKTPELSNCQ
jgi:hypothetical protein